MDLVAPEEIRRLKYRYLRCVDLKVWDEFAEVFTEDAVAEYDTPVLGKVLRLEGRDAIVDYMRSDLGEPEHHLLIRGAAFYHDTYRRLDDGTWRVAKTGHRRTYEYMVSLEDAPSLKFTTSH